MGIGSFAGFGRNCFLSDLLILRKINDYCFMNFGMKLQNILLKKGSLFLLFCLLFWTISGQETAKSDFVEAKFFSQQINQEVSYRIIFPNTYQSDDNKRFPVIYLLHGRGGNYRDWTNLTKIAQYSKAYNFIIVSVEGGKESWYADNPSQPNQNYESYIIKEFIPEIDAKYRTIANRENRIIAGLSMGGYGSLKFGLKYPEKFFLAGSFSGAMDAVIRTKNYPHLIKSVADVFGDENSQMRKDNDLTTLINNASPEKLKTFPFMYFVCGTEDHQFQSNKDLNDLLTDKRFPHEYRQMPGLHNWTFWDESISEFLKTADKLWLQNQKVNK